LLTLANTTSPQNKKITLLHYLAGVLRKKEDLYTFEDDLSLLDTASKVELGAVRADFQCLHSRIHSAKQEVLLLQADSAGTPTDNFARDMEEACIVGAPSQLEELTFAMQETQEIVAKTTMFFGDKPEGLQEMLQVMHTFVREFRQVKEELESARFAMPC